MLSPDRPDGLRVLVTRPRHTAGTLAARLSAMGHHPLLASVLEVHPLAPSLPAPASIQAVLVASANAVDALPHRFAACRLLAVGRGTAERARARGFTTVHSADGTAQDLAALARATCLPAGLPLLLAHGAGQGQTLAATLQRAGFALITAPVYRATAVTRLPAETIQAWQSGGIDVATFFSAATARAFIRLIAPHGTQQAAPQGAASIEAHAISAPVARALAPLPWRTLRVAVRPDLEAMLALLS